MLIELKIRFAIKVYVSESRDLVIGLAVTWVSEFRVWPLLLLLSRDFSERKYWPTLGWEAVESLNTLCHEISEIWWNYYSGWGIPDELWLIIHTRTCRFSTFLTQNKKQNLFPLYNKFGQPLRNVSKNTVTTLINSALFLSVIGSKWPTLLRCHRQPPSQTISYELDISQVSCFSRLRRILLLS